MSVWLSCLGVSDMSEMKDSGIDWIGNIPKDWHMDKLKYHLKRNESKNPGNQQVLSLYREYGIIPKDSRDDNHNVTSEDTSKYKYVQKGNFVINKMKAWQGSVAVSDFEGIVSPAYYVYEFTDRKFDKKFFHYLLRSCYKDEFRRLSGGIREGQWDLPSEALNNTPIVFPEIAIQERIAQFLDSKCEEIDALSIDIQAEIDTLEEYKRSLIIEKVTKGLNPDVRMKDSGLEWLGEIPDKWRLSRIGSVYELRNLKVSDKDYIPLSVTKKGVVPQLETAAKTNAHDDRKLVKKGDFVINSRSDRRGSCGISSYEGSVSLINTILAPLGEMNPRYYDWLFHTVQFGDEFYKWGHGIVDDLWTTNWQDMKKITIPMPDLDEQEKIASFLDEKCAKIDIIIEIKKEQLIVLDEYKKAIIYEYVTGKKQVRA